MTWNHIQKFIFAFEACSKHFVLLLQILQPHNSIIYNLHASHYACKSRGNFLPLINHLQVTLKFLRAKFATIFWIFSSIHANLIWRKCYLLWYLTHCSVLMYNLLIITSFQFPKNLTTVPSLQFSLYMCIDEIRAVLRFLRIWR